MTNEALEAAARALHDSFWTFENKAHADGHFLATKEHHIEKAQACIAAYLEASWRPMDEAPRDGTPIIVEGGPIMWSGGNWFSLASQRHLLWEPTRFCHLPKPPAIDAMGEKG